MKSSPYTLVWSDAGQEAAGFDCDCACPQPLPHASGPPLAHDARVQRHQLLRQIALADGYSAIFVPSLSRVAVANTATLELIECLAEPQTVGTLPDDQRALVQQLYELGILHLCGASDLVPADPEALVVWMHVTNACNLRCTYCYIDKTDESMSHATAMAAVDAVVRTARQHGYNTILLKYAGGEASLNLPLVEEIHRYAQEQAAQHDLKLDGVVLSNGVGLTTHKLRCIKDLGLRLMISLDGLAAAHDAQRPKLGGQGSFAACIKSIERAQALGCNLVISVTVTHDSAVGLPDIVGWLLERNLRFSLNFYRDHACGGSVADLRLHEQQLIERMRAAYRVIEQRLPSYSLLGCLLDRTNLGAPHARTCAVGENYLVIDQHGGVAACQMEIDRPVTTVWATDPLNIIRLHPMGVQNLPVDQKEGCRSCEWRYWCAGGCAVATFRTTGRYDVQSPNCGIYKALYPEVVRLEGLRLLKHV